MRLRISQMLPDEAGDAFSAYTDQFVGKLRPYIDGTGKRE